MNKKILIAGLLTIATITGTIGVHHSANVNADSEATVTTLMNSYYHNGNYNKHTNIFITQDAVNKLVEKNGFHQTSELERTTYYTPNALWMSRSKEAEGVKYSYYGTDENGNLTNGTANTALVAPSAGVAATKSHKDWHNTEEDGMEGFYVTLKDISKTDSTKWSKNGNVYYSEEENIINLFKAFCAPCYLGFTEGTSNYIDLVKAEIEETANGLELRLIVHDTDTGKIINGGTVFARATVTKRHSFSSVLSSNAEGHYHECIEINCNENDGVVTHTWDKGTMTRSSYSRVYVCECEKTKSEQKVKIYFTNNWGWTNVYAYAWDKNVTTGNYGTNKSWPGIAASKTNIKNDYGQEIYYYEVDLTKYDYIIFNNNNDKQTQDLDLYALGTDNQYYMEWNSTKGDHAVSTYFAGK